MLLGRAHTLPSEASSSLNVDTNYDAFASPSCQCRSPDFQCSKPRMHIPCGLLWSHTVCHRKQLHHREHRIANAAASLWNDKGGALSVGFREKRGMSWSTRSNSYQGMPILSHFLHDHAFQKHLRSPPGPTGTTNRSTMFVAS